MNEKILIKVKDLNKIYLVQKKPKVVLKKINFEIEEGKTLGLVGESGSGKTTIGKIILKLLQATSGEVFYEKVNILNLKENQFKSYRKKIQIVFQDPYSSLNPRMTVKDILDEPLKIHKISEKNKAQKLLDLVQLPSYALKKFPHEFSGGQRQRIGIARALSLNPKFLVLDEPVSALDVSIQAQIINLLKELQENLNLTFLLISHDLAIVKHISHQIAVIHQGEIVELASPENIFSKKPSHEYTKKLIEAALLYPEENIISS